MFIPTFTSARQLSLTWAISVQHITHLTSWKSIIQIFSRLRFSLPSGTIPPSFPTKILYKTLQSPIHTPCPAHFIILDFIKRKIFGEQYRSLSTSLYIVLDSYAVSFLQETNILHIIINHYRVLYNHSSLHVQWTTPSISQEIPPYILC